ncbi:hypothetical protein KJ644_04105 [Candidatus Dependentiae bacterium]|nr:hypothetical protein [Candidatus Dependentiae bacterium]MBU4387629.1 hypothetical protein [Candidatus Dependentiae bacterium]MCG2756458.1 hypothetical protein [Candidatus Dependentiae bacterium]
MKKIFLSIFCLVSFFKVQAISFDEKFVRVFIIDPEKSITDVKNIYSNVLGKIVEKDASIIYKLKRNLKSFDNGYEVKFEKITEYFKKIIGYLSVLPEHAIIIKRLEDLIKCFTVSYYLIENGMDKKSVDKILNSNQNLNEIVAETILGLQKFEDKP